jgi:hypothetical protein
MPAPGDHGVPRRTKAGGWYGWKILIADGGAVLLTVSTSTLGPIIGGGAYLLTAPSIHLGHKRGLAALGSLSLRIAAPLALNAMIEHEPCGPDPCLQPGVLAGAALASLVDVAFLAHDSEDSKSKEADRFVPAVAVSQRGAVLVVAGAF